MQPKVIGAAYRQPGAAASQGSGALSMDFETAKRVATEKRQEAFEMNAKRFYGEDGWNKSQYKGSANAFWGV